MSKSLATAALVAIAGGIAIPIAAAEIITFNIALSGSQEVPPNPSPGTGSAHITIDTVTRFVQVSGTVSGLMAPVTAGHVHGLAAPGATAGVLIAFTTIPITIAGNFSGSGFLSVANFDGLMNGLTYVNIHTLAYPGGEIRGQIVIPPPCPGDINDDELINGKDLVVVLGGWGPCNGCTADINDDGNVDGQDLALVLGGWGPCP